MESGCIGIQRAGVDSVALTEPCPRKVVRECCGHAFCAQCYSRDHKGVHPPADKDLARRRRAA